MYLVKWLFALDVCEVIVDLALSASYHLVIEILTPPSLRSYKSGWTCFERNYSLSTRNAVNTVQSCTYTSSEDLKAHICKLPWRKRWRHMIITVIQFVSSSTCRWWRILQALISQLLNLSAWLWWSIMFSLLILFLKVTMYWDIYIIFMFIWRQNLK